MSDWLEAYGRITHLTDDEKAWWDDQEEAEYFATIVSTDDADAEWVAEVGKHYLKFTDLPQVSQVDVVQEFFKRFRLGQCVTITWACESGAYRGGGACLLSATQTKWINTSEWAEKQEKEFYRKRKKRKVK